MKKFTLVGVDGNAFAVMGYTARAMRQAGLGAEVNKMLDEAKSGDYNNLLRVCDDYIQKANEALGRNEVQDDDDWDEDEEDEDDEEGEWR